MADTDKLYQDALNQINAVNTPDINQMRIQLMKLQQQGVLTPQQVQAELIKNNAYKDISTNPELASAQQSALAQLQERGEAGFTPIERAQIEDINQNINTAAKGRQGAIEQQARERGVGGSGLEMAMQEGADQAATDRASRMGLDVAAKGQERALEAMQAGGNLATGLRGQEFGEKALVAGSQNAIDAANAAVLNRANAANAAIANQAQAANLGEKQRISDVNAGTTNQQNVYNARLPEQQFQNEMEKAGAQSKIYQDWAGQEARQNAQKRGENLAIGGGLLQAGATLGGAALGGPLGAMAGSQAGRAFQPRNPTEATFNTEEMRGYAGGGMVPGVPRIPGDHPANDTQLIKASPGEMVLPRSATQNLMGAFLQHMKQPSMGPSTSANVDPIHIAKTLKALSIIHSGGV